MGLGRIDDEARFLKRLSAQKHAKPHLMPGSERDFRRNLDPGENKRGLDHATVLALSVRADDGALLNQRGDAFAHDAAVTLKRMNLETHVLLFAFFENFNVEGVQGRGPRPGVDPRLDRRKPEIRQGAPLGSPDQRLLAAFLAFTLCLLNLISIAHNAALMVSQTGRPGL